jgi:hypothetical protein
VASSAPRLDSKLLAAVVRMHDDSLPIAEINRRVGEIALALGLTKPSYEQVRVLVHALRRRQLDPSTGEILLDIAFRARPPEALFDHLSGVGVPRRPK